MKWIVFILIASVSVSIIPSIDAIQQNGMEVIQMDTTIQLENDASRWMTVLTIKTLQNITSEEPITLKFPEIYSVTSVDLQNLSSPFRVTHSDGWSMIELTPIIRLYEGDIFSISIRGLFEPNLIMTGEKTWLFQYPWGFNYPISNVKIEVVLPRYSSLSFKEGKTNVFPSGVSTFSNGTHASLIWMFQNYNSPGNVETIIIEYQFPRSTGLQNEKPGSNLFFVGLVIGVLFVLSVLYILKKKGIVVKWLIVPTPPPEQSVNIKTIYQPVVLKPQELRILLLIQEREPISQSELIDQLGLSKSRVSQYLKSLEENNLITKEKDGKENVITMKYDIKLNK